MPERGQAAGMKDVLTRVLQGKASAIPPEIRQVCTIFAHIRIYARFVGDKKTRIVVLAAPHFCCTQLRCADNQT
jgi:hypothetical protein